MKQLAVISIPLFITMISFGLCLWQQTSLGVLASLAYPIVEIYRSMGYV